MADATADCRRGRVIYAAAASPPDAPPSLRFEAIICHLMARPNEPVVGGRFHPLYQDALRRDERERAWLDAGES